MLLMIWIPEPLKVMSVYPRTDYPFKYATIIAVQMLIQFFIRMAFIASLHLSFGIDFSYRKFTS